jgi:subtilisin-like proprotein convertase family protein
VAYIPNNAYLVRASADVARRLADDPLTQAVVPYEPYYKVKPPVLEAAFESDPSTSRWLNLLLFPDSDDSTIAMLESYGAQVLSKESSPFGPLLKVRSSLENLHLFAALPAVQEIELSRARLSANDLSRAAIGVATNSVTPANYLDLTGTNVIVNVNDTGVDANQPELLGRVFFDVPSSGSDSNGHGTHVSGIIAGSGRHSATVINAPGSSLPPVDLQFRGMAPSAKIFALATGLDSGPLASDAYLQQMAARTNAFISNNSWHYAGDNDYDVAAASYDAAVRDALPTVPGSQALLYVFAAGNSGHGRDDGTGGDPDTIQSPATAKNVITIGAVELPRLITNQTWTCTTTTGDTTCVTNAPWLPLTDSANQVASFSSRGNVGLGIEGEFGRFKPDLVAPGTFVLSTRSQQWDERTYYTQTNDFLNAFPDTNYFQVLSNLNESAGPLYRFESGTSLAASVVSGTLALMQEFFEQRLGQTNSPALMKALLINGARAVGNSPEISPRGSTNSQGWGQVHLPNSLPGSLTNEGSAGSSMLLFDQNPLEALATGESRTRYLTVSPPARGLPLRITLVWTDPPANPIAGVKLVNDLDLLVTNLDTGEVFFGNDISPGNNFNLPWNPNTPPNLDIVNNVENIFLRPVLAGNYSVSVFGRHINVNSVTTHTNAVAQDYALVVSSGDGEVTNALALAGPATVSASSAPLTILTNTFSSSAGDVGAIVLHERVGANSPLVATNTIALSGNTNELLTVGTTNQWHFYVATNATSATNAAFLTFLPASLASLAGNTSSIPSTVSGRLEADIDLYVSRDPRLMNLDPLALAAADFSVGRGGTETVIYTNASSGVYYIGVKSESQQAAEYGLLAVFSEQPFAVTDPSGNEMLRGFPAPVGIPAGSPALPGTAYMFCLEPNSIPVRRLIATNTITHPQMTDLQGTLWHGLISAVLNNHSTNGILNGQAVVYDDSQEADIAGAQPSDGPGSLQAFAGQDGCGQWRLTMMSTNQPGSDDGLGLFLERQQDLTTGIAVSILPGACRKDFLSLPNDISSLSAGAMLGSGGPVSWNLYPIYSSTSSCPTILIEGPPTNAATIIDATSHPPINPGLYVSRVCNRGTEPADLNISASLALAPNPPAPATFTSSSPIQILDDALSFSTIEVTNLERVLSSEVGVRIDHPRVSDLALTLISPKGTRVLLDENRGGSSSAGIGLNVIATNVTPVSSTGGPQASTNILDTGEVSGIVAINYDFYALPDDMRIYYEGQLLYDSGLVSSAGVTNINYGPGNSTSITIIMNEGGNVDTNTAWFYTVTFTHPVPLYFTFTENTNLASFPIKFAPVPLTNLTYSIPGNASSGGIFYLPEESLGRVAAESAFGQWTLEIRDDRAGASLPPPRLLSWQLSFLLEDSVPAPIPLLHEQPSTNLLGPGQLQWFSVDTPSWSSFATNSLLSSSLPVDLFYNLNSPPTGTNAGDFALLLNSTSGTFTLLTNSSPPLIPGSRFYLGIQNTNRTTVAFIIEASFDVANVLTLQSGVPAANLNVGPINAIDYYRFVVTTNAVRVQFEINAPTADVTLLARKGRPPTLDSYDLVSSNPGTNDELIVLYDYSSPIPMSPGEWFLSAVNVSGGSASYSIMATEFPEYGTNLVIINPVADATGFCLSWNSLPGVHYYLQGKANLNDLEWTTVSPTLTALDVLSSSCVLLPNPFRFFRVREGLVLSTPTSVITSLSVSTNGVLLLWTSAGSDKFSVQWTDSLLPPRWTAFNNTITSTNGAFSFLDDGSQSGARGSQRFYRLQQLP